VENVNSGERGSGLRRAPERPVEAPLSRELGLRLIAAEALVIRRVRCGRGFSYIAANGTVIRDPRVRRRLVSLAVPPAYEDVRYAADPAAHLQAIGRDAAGRLQYRYHPEWERVRETTKAERLVRLIGTLPRIRRAVTVQLSRTEPIREFALAAVVELVAATATKSGKRRIRSPPRDARRRDIVEIQCHPLERDNHLVVPRKRRQAGDEGDTVGALVCCARPLPP